MTFVAQPYDVFADGLLTALTGGLTREEHQFVGVEEPYSLASPGALPSTVHVFGQRNAAGAAFEGGVDYDYLDADGAIRWKAGGRLPDDHSYFYVSYYPAECRRRLTDRNPGSVTTTLAEAFARELAVLHKQMEMIYLSAFADSARGASLDHVAALLALARKDAKFAGGEVLFKRSTPADGDITIPAGTLLSTDDGRNFETTDKRTLRKGQLSVLAPIRAQAEGADGRVPKGRVRNINRPIFGIESVTNDAPTFFATEKETDDELRRRMKGTLERAGKSTVNAIKFTLIEEIPGVNEGNVMVTESREVPGKVDVKFGLGGAVDPSLVGRIEEAIFNSRPAGVRVGHNLPTRSNGGAEVPAGTPAVGIQQFARPGGAVRAHHVAPDVLALMPEGLFQLRIEALLRLNEPNLSASQKEAIEDTVRAAIVGYVDALPMGADVVYSKLLGRVVDSDGVGDVVLSVRAAPPGAEPGEAFRDNLSTDGRKASVEQGVFIGLMEEPIHLDVLVRLERVRPTVDSGSAAPSAAPSVTPALKGAVEDSVRAVVGRADRTFTRAALEQAVKSAVAGAGGNLRLADSRGVVLNAEYEETGRLLSDTEGVTAEANELLQIRSVDISILGDLDG